MATSSKNKSFDLVEHVMEHYVHRDLARILMRDYMERTTTRYTIYPGAVSFLRDPNNIGSLRAGSAQSFKVNDEVYHRTKSQLYRVKFATLVHIHNLLHDDLMMDEFKHVHVGEDMYQYVIEEESDAYLL